MVFTSNHSALPSVQELAELVLTAIGATLYSRLVGLPSALLALHSCTTQLGSPPKEE